jgi:hypothetical protein
MSRFRPLAIASWAGMCPGNNESGRQTPHRIPARLRWLETALIEAAKAAARSGHYLSAHYTASVAGGTAKATVAGHSILVICWHLPSTGETYTDLGGDY